MYNIYTKQYRQYFDIKCTTVIDDVLYIIVLEGEITNTVKLIKFDLKRMIEVEAVIIDYVYQADTVFRFIKDSLYCCSDSVDGLVIIKVHNLDEMHCKMTSLKCVVEINGDAYYICGEKIYYIISMMNNENVFIIDTRGVGTYVDDYTIHLGTEFKLDFKSNVYYSDNYLVILNNKNVVFFIDIDTKEIKFINKHVNHLKDEKKYVFIGNDKLFGYNIIYDYMNGNKIDTNLDIKNSFKYNGADYYVHKNNKNFNISVHVNENKHDEYNDEYNNDEYMIIGSESNIFIVPVSLMYNNSGYIQNLIKTFGITEFIDGQYNTIHHYIDYLQNGVIDLKSICELYKIASLLDDFNMEGLIYSIIEKVKNDCTDINIAWDVLETIYNDDVLNVFKILLYTIYTKYDRVNFMSMLNNRSKMNDLIIADIIKIQIDKN